MIEDEKVELVDVEHPSSKKARHTTNKFRVSASSYSKFVDLDCKLFLRRHVDTDKDKNETVLAKSLSERMKMRGDEWETRICKFLNDSSVQLIDCTKLDPLAEIERIIKSNQTSPHYLYQAKFDIAVSDVPEELIQVDASISNLIPDLLRLSRTGTHEPWTLTVIDAKSSLNLKQPHQAQVAFYVYFLTKVFSDKLEQGHMQMSGKGAVWLQPAQSDCSEPLIASIKEFHLKPWLQLVERGLRNEIPGALSGDIEDVPWRLNTNCASCQYLEECRKDKPYGMDVRALPHVSAVDSKLLLDLAGRHSATSLRESNEDARSVQALHSALSEDIGISTSSSFEHQRAMRAVGAPTDGSRPDLGALTSVLTNQLLPKSLRCGTFPNNSDDIPIFISLCCDPAFELPFACTIKARGVEDFSVVASFATDQQELRMSEERLLVAMLTHLCDIVDQLRDESPRTGVTFYVWEALERSCLTQLVIKSLCGELMHLVSAEPSLVQRVRYLALVLLDHPDQWHLDVPPSPERNFAATPRVCEMIGQFRILFHLPVRGFFSPGQIASCIDPTESALSHDIAVESIERDWAQEGGAEARLISRMHKLVSAAQFLQSRVDKKLLFNQSAPLPSVTIVDRYNSRHPVLQRLIFMKYIDAFVKCYDKRHKRIAALNNSEQEIRLRCTHKQDGWGDFEQLSGPPVFADKPNEVANKWCLVQNNAKTIVNFVDLAYLNEMKKCVDLEVAFVSVQLVSHSVRADTSVYTLQCTLPGKFCVSVGDVCVLFARVVELNLKKSIDSLELMCESLTATDDNTMPRTFVDLIDNPNSWSERDKLGDGAEPALSCVKCSLLTTSLSEVNLIYRNANELHGGHASPYAGIGPLVGVQANAFQSLLCEKLTILWGPPGTGKTHFTAKSILNLFEMISRHGRNPRLRVLVCATTHDAINELLKKFVSLKALALSISKRQDTAQWAKCKVIKYVQDKTEEIEGVVFSDAPTKVTNESFVVVGATIWSLYKKKKSKAGDLGAYEGNFKGLFDVVVIDEASQMPVSDALMPLSCLKEGPEGRLLVVGDTLQLPPIFAHKFGPPPLGVPPVQSSVLECLLRTASNLPVDLPGVIEGCVPPPPRMIKLSENFRMNTALSRFTSRLYGTDYVSSAVSRNRDGKWDVREDAVLRALLPAAFVGGRESLPELMTVRLVPRSADGCVLNDDQLVRCGDFVLLGTEARVVAELVCAIASSQTDVDPDEAAKAIFVCTPHNNQKSGIVSELSKRGHAGWSAIADTAERMQGQERDVVVICLGFLSAELVAREVDFLYSKQRLNVAISRAKKSCIVVYTDAVMALNPAVIGNVDTSEAYAHLQAFIDESENQSAKCDFVVTL